jgi:hypothetical protein
MKKITAVFLSLVFLGFSMLIMGMSGLGTPANQSAVTSSFSFKITDIDNTEIELSSVTIDGKTTFGGYLGKGKVQIPFATIAHIDLNKDAACVTMVDSTQVCNIKTNTISRLYGNTPFGAYQIALKDLKTLVIVKR